MPGESGTASSHRSRPRRVSMSGLQSLKSPITSTRFDAADVNHDLLHARRRRLHLEALDERRVRQRHRAPPLFDIGQYASSRPAMPNDARGKSAERQRRLTSAAADDTRCGR